MSTALWALAIIYGLSLAVVIPATTREVARRDEEDR